MSLIQKLSYEEDQQKCINLKNAIYIYKNYLIASCLSTNTIYCYSRDLDSLLKKIGNINLNTISVEMINQLIICLRNSSIKSTGLSNSSTNRIKSTYRTFFNWCFTNNFSNQDYSKSIRLTKTSSKPTLAITKEEIKILLNTILYSNDSHSKRDYALFSVYAFSGIRKSEALALRICDFDPAAKTLVLPKSIRSSKKIQIIPSILSQILNEYLNSCSEIRATKNTSPLFSGITDNAFLSGRQASNRFQKWRSLSAIREYLTIHSLRAAYATQLYKYSRDPFLVSLALGHSSFETTKRYIQYDLLNFHSVIDNTFTIQ
jgi:site-specific recombinase XerD